jgi:hypothetical protein
MNASQLAVQFIASLSPQYFPENDGGFSHARNVETGVLISPVLVYTEDGGHQDPEDDDPNVLLGFPHSHTPIACPARFVAAAAVVSYVQFHGTGYPLAIQAAELRMLTNHFAVKTGLHLYLPSVPESESLPERFRNSVMGQGLLTEAIAFAAKRALGIP